MKERIDAAVRAVIFGIIAASAGVTAFSFGTVAVFLWAQRHYDTIVACGVLGVAFLLIALFALLILAFLNYRVKKAPRTETIAAANALPTWLSDPSVLLAVVQIVRGFGLGRFIPIALVGAAAFGVAKVMGNHSAPQTRKTYQEPPSRAA